jgi:hypothetical protein
VDELELVGEEQMIRKLAGSGREDQIYRNLISVSSPLISCLFCMASFTHTFHQTPLVHRKGKKYYHTPPALLGGKNTSTHLPPF